MELTIDTEDKTRRIVDDADLISVQPMSCALVDQVDATDECLPSLFEAIDRDTLYAQFAPLVKRLILHYGGCPQLREELVGEIYCRFCALLDAFDPTRGVPLRAYLVRQLSTSVYTYVRTHRRHGSREFCSNPERVGSYAER